MTTPCSGEEGGANRNSPSLLMGMQNDPHALENKLIIPYKVKYGLNLMIHTFHSEVFTSKNEELRSHKNLYINICGIFIPIHSKLETAQIFLAFIFHGVL